MNIKQISVTALLMGALFLPGCGYTSHTVLPRDIRTIYVDTVKNRIPVDQIYAYVPGLEMDITQAVIRRFQTDGNLRIVPEDEADAVLTIDWIGFEQEGLRFTSLESVEEYRLFILLDLKLIDARTQDVIFREPNFSGDSEYFVSDVRTINREEAARKAVDRLARNVVDRVVEDW